MDGTYSVSANVIGGKIVGTLWVTLFETNSNPVSLQMLPSDAIRMAKMLIRCAEYVQQERANLAPPEDAP